MKKASTLLLFVFFMLAACDSTDEPEVVSPSITDEDSPPVEPANSVAAPVVAGSAGSFSPATTMDEAAVIRSQDHVIGADEPVVAIIEYGDYQ